MKIDEQTLRDLEIFNSPDKISIFEKADRTITKGGRQYLKYFFKNPLNNITEIKERQLSFLYIIRKNWKITIHNNQIYFIKNYLKSNISPIESQNTLKIFLKGTTYLFRHKDSGLFNYYEYFKEGVEYIKGFLDLLNNIKKSINNDAPDPIKSIKTSLEKFFRITDIKKLYKSKIYNLSFIDIFYYDNVFRNKYKHQLYDVIKIFYEIDALISLKNFVDKYNLTYPVFIESENPVLEINNVFHLMIKKPKKIDFKFQENKNFVFLTGPNMSGKTTLLKSIGLSVYLAHLGLGVPADYMKLTYFEELISDINTRDNINRGYSYFFNEVRRVKNISSKISSNKRILVILDELFRGTNIKDAFDGTELVINGFTRWEKSLFILSSHLVELDKKIKKNPNIAFKYFDSQVINNKPHFNYILKNGVSKKRIGLLILENEEIPQILFKKEDR